MNTSTDQNEKAGNFGAGNQLLRWGLITIRVAAILMEVTIFIVVISWLALIVADRWLVDITRLWPWLMFGSGGVAIIALLNLSNSLLQSLWAVISAAWNSDQEGYNRNSAKLAKDNWVSLFALVLGIVLLEVGKDVEDQKQAEKISNIILERHADMLTHDTNVSWSLYVQQYSEKSPVTSTSGTASSDYVASFPILFDRAALRDGIPLDATSIEDVDLEYGVTYDDSLNNKMLSKLVDALLPCGTDDGLTPLRIRIEGYASSEPYFRFKDIDGKPVEDGQYVNSVAFNVRTANVRAANLAYHLKHDLVPENYKNRFDISADTWNTITDMESARGLNDRPLGGGETDFPQDFLTRSAAIRITDPGKCKVTNG